MTLTREQVQAYLELEKKTTQGPWYVVHGDSGGDDGLRGDFDYNDATYTVSAIKNIPGCDKDSGYPAYGIPFVNADFIAQSRTIAPQLAEALLQAWDEVERLQQDFASYRETAEEIQDCYANSHQDNWLFEKTLRRIANKSLDEVDNIGLFDGSEPQKIALNALETVWKRRVERSKRKALEVHE